MPPETNPETQPSRGTVFLTFDDGPNKGTEHLVAKLQEHAIRGTIFMVGKQARAYKGKLLDDPKLLVETADVGNHSNTHAEYRSPGSRKTAASYQSYYAGNNAPYVAQDFERAEGALDAFGMNHSLARFPGRNTWRADGVSEDDKVTKDTKDEADSIAARKYRIFGWDTEWERGFKMNKHPASAQQLANTIAAMITKGSTKKSGKVVVLMHDDMFSSQASAEKLSELIRLLKKKGLSFDVLSNY